jgi:hypothetical protein
MKLWIVSLYVSYEGNYEHQYFLKEHEAEEFLTHCNEQGSDYGDWELEEVEAK